MWLSVQGTPWGKLWPPFIRQTVASTHREHDLTCRATRAAAAHRSAFGGALQPGQVKLLGCRSTLQIKVDGVAQPGKERSSRQNRSAETPLLLLLILLDRC
jgi:hypothetical protein